MRDGLRLAMIFVMFALFMFACSKAARGANSPNATLNAVASNVAGHPVSVWCETSDRGWVDLENQHNTGEDDGFTVQGEPTVYLAPRICDTLEYMLGYGYQATGLLWDALAIKTLLHESVHQRGITDEGVTDCTALSLLPQYVTDFGIPATVSATSYTRVTRAVRITFGVRHKVVRYSTMVPSTTQVPNPDLQKLENYAESWHKSLPASYQGGC